MVSTPSEKNGECEYKVFSKKQLNEYPEVKTWLKNVGSSSYNVYMFALQKLCNWCGKDDAICTEVQFTASHPEVFLTPPHQQLLHMP